MTIGIIDIGSNTIRMNLYLIQKNSIQLLSSNSQAAGLASYIQKNEMSRAGIEKLLSVLSDFQNILQLLHADECAVFATACLRNISNSAAVLETVQNQLKIRIDLLSGEREGSLSFQGAFSGLKNPQGMYIDSGGGSTEVVVYNENGIVSAASMPVGCLNLYHQYVSQILPDQKEVSRILARVRQELSAIHIEKGCCSYQVLSVTGGSFRAVRALLIKWNLLSDSQYFLQPSLLKELLARLMNDPSAAFHTIVQVCPERIHTILPGLLIVMAIMDYVQPEEIQVCMHGLREGYLMEWMSSKELL